MPAADSTLIRKVRTLAAKHGPEVLEEIHARLDRECVPAGMERTLAVVSALLEVERANEVSNQGRPSESVESERRIAPVSLAAFS